MRYFTKSRFRLALDCVTKLYYTNKKHEYADQNIDDPFLQALADGGFQVGELAKYLFSNDPCKENITIDTLDHEEAIKETAKRLEENESIVIAEAAFAYKNLFVRTDILVKQGNSISIYEVKAKSFAPQASFLTRNGEKILSNWIPYLYDVAFQKYVVANSNACKSFKVGAYLTLVDKSSKATIDGLNQLFKIVKHNGRSRVEVKEGLKSHDTGDPILTSIPVDEICERIYNEFPVPSDLGEEMGFSDFVWTCVDLYENDIRQFTAIGSKCTPKSCQFRKTAKDPDGLKSGFMECWQHHAKLSDADLTAPLVTELWNGRAGAKSFADDLVRKGKFLLKDVVLEDIEPKSASKQAVAGLSPLQRRMQQIERAKEQTQASYINIEGIKREMGTWKFPLHMIDFETSMVALPFHKNVAPYEGIAFQFSHHTIDEHWNIQHASQFLSFEAGKFPNYDFARELMSSLNKDCGSIFRYHNHENNYLNLLYSQLNSNSDAPHDKNELMSFIKSITHSSKGSAESWVGNRDMIDLYELVLSYYFAPSAKGSNGLKQILPAIIKDSDYLKGKYSKSGVYGKHLEVVSLNFGDHIWIDPQANFDPYKTLPKVFPEYENEQLDQLLAEFEDLADGGAALTAYNYLQYSELPLAQRQNIKEALLRYCELDTMAMVMICEAWNEWGKN